MTQQLSSAASLIGLQVGSRLATFVLTQVLVRLTSPEIFGAAHIHLELLLATVLTLSREGFRGALARRSLSPSSSSSSPSSSPPSSLHVRPPSLQNVAFLPVPLGLVLAVCATLSYRTWLAPHELRDHAHFDTALATFALGAALEVVSEPLYTLAIASGRLSTRAWAEGLAVAAKGIGTLAAVFLLRDTDTDGRSLLPVGVGQACYGAMTLAVLVTATAQSSASRGHTLAMLLPNLSRSQKPAADRESKGTGGSQRFDAQTMQLATTMTRQTVVKHVLGEADKFAVARLATLGDQGAYALATNYGSLVVRMLYQPIEESARINLSRTLGSLSGSGDKKAEGEALSSATFLLRSLLSLHVILGLFLVIFCPPLTRALLLLVAGPRWAYATPAPAILALYGSLALPCMAFNGLLEGFLQACASPDQLRRYDRLLILASATFLALVATLSYTSAATGAGLQGHGLGERIVIVASSVSIAMRAAYSWHFSLAYVKHAKQRLGQDEKPTKKEDIDDGGFSPRAVLPHGVTVLTFLASAAVLRWSEATTRTYAPPRGWREALLQRDSPLAKHVALGVSCAALCAACCVSLERKTLRNALNAIRGRRH